MFGIKLVNMQKYREAADKWDANIQRPKDPETHVEISKPKKGEQGETGKTSKSRGVNKKKRGGQSGTKTRNKKQEDTEEGEEDNEAVSSGEYSSNEY